MFKGTITALITPFQEGKIDLAAYEKLIDWQVSAGIHGLLPCGSTGESLMLTHEEQKQLIDCCVKVVDQRVPVIAGTSAITPKETIKLTQQAQSLGVDGALIVTPAYVKPGPEALYQYYKTVHDAVDIPIIIYNNPVRTGLTMDLQTIERLAQLPRIIGIKDATSILTRPTETRLAIGPDFKQFSGEDPTAFGFLAQGGADGWISASANIIPQFCAQVFEAWEAQDLKTFSDLRDKLFPFMKAMFMETNPVAIKYAASVLGLCRNEVRSPLLEATPKTEETVRSLITQIGITLEMQVRQRA